MFHVSGRLDVIFYPNHLPCCSTLHRHYAERVAKHVCNLISRAHAGFSAEHRNLIAWHHGFISLMPYLVKKRVVNAIHLSANIVFAYKGSEYLGDFLQSQYYTVSIPSNVVSMKVYFIILLVSIIL